jgi:hypothetical protein
MKCSFGEIQLGGPIILEHLNQLPIPKNSGQDLDGINITMDEDPGITPLYQKLQNLLIKLAPNNINNLEYLLLQPRNILNLLLQQLIIPHQILLALRRCEGQLGVFEIGEGKGL